MLSYFLLCNNVKQLHVYIHPLSVEPLFPSPHPTHLGHHTASQSWAPCPIQELPPSYLFTHSSANKSIPISKFIPTPALVHTSVLYVCISIPTLQIGSLILFFSRIHIYILIHDIFSLSDLFCSDRLGPSMSLEMTRLAFLLWLIMIWLYFSGVLKIIL